ncbi:MAG: hypothetical protein WCQ50_14945 [Spirochaetota bacterium]
MASTIGSFNSQIKDIDFILFKKTDLRAFFKKEAETLDETEIGLVFDDLFAFNAYLGRIEDYGFIEKVPFWEYSVCLEWCETHMMFGDVFELNLKNARRFLGNLRRYYDFLTDQGKLTDSSELRKAEKHIAGGKRLRLVKEIPYTGTETYTALTIGKETFIFDMADYWLLILLATLFDDNWTMLLEAAFGISGERAQKVKGLQKKVHASGMSGLRDIMYSDVQKSDVKQANAWFYGSGGQ